MPYLNPPGRIDKDAKAERDKRIFDLWMQCWTQEQIAEAVGCSIGQVNSICSEMADLPKLNKSDLALAEHATDFEVPIYNVWKPTRHQGYPAGVTGNFPLPPGFDSGMLPETAHGGCHDNIGQGSSRSAPAATAAGTNPD